MRDMASSSGLPFLKMHGLGNDFVVIDLRSGDAALRPSLVAAIADRHRGVGFDQLAVIQPSDDQIVAADLTFYNADGSRSGACGNATRCIADHLMRDRNLAELTLRTERGALACERAENGQTRVNMGHPLTDWQDIPLAQAMDTLALPLEGAPVATGMGNPHCTFFVDDVDAVDLAVFGPELEHNPLFPERANVQIAQLVAPDQLRMRVWERGAGITLASGSSSCATAVAAARRGLTGRKVRVHLDGGQLDVHWGDDGVWMTGPTSHVYTGVLTPNFLASVSDEP
ncbi:diaminopimelate epimerase [Actibacterium sp. 188UL27-1]|nr:diaminopimelate epimerase [Actibacterium sp. 188UL27-1]MBM7069887.1 diaminopimelate epimerase [Actibacterium sp. 188UL27-1]